MRGPFTGQVASWNSEGIPTIARDDFEDVQPYILALLESHDNVIGCQLNAVHSVADGEAQLCALVMKCALLHHFPDKEYNKEPFALTLTDLHPANIMVDDDGHITSLVDPDWACYLPVEMLTPPFRLAEVAATSLEHENLVDEFLGVFKTQENNRQDLLQ